MIKKYVMLINYNYTVLHNGGVIIVSYTYTERGFKINLYAKLTEENKHLLQYFIPIPPKRTSKPCKSD